MITSVIAMGVARNRKSSPGAIRSLLNKMAIDLGSTGKDKVFGWGLIDKSSLYK